MKQAAITLQSAIHQALVDGLTLLEVRQLTSEAGAAFDFRGQLTSETPKPPLPRRVLRAARRAVRNAGVGNKIQSIKLVRSTDALTLVDAKRAVEQVLLEPGFVKFQRVW